MTQLRLKLLGGFQAEEKGGQAILVSSRKARALLSYLALKSGKSRSRHELANLLWGGREERRAHSCLRQCIFQLRKTFRSHPALLFSDGDQLGCSSDIVNLDIAEFHKLGKARNSDSLLTAVRLYRGPLLDGLHINEDPWDAWLTEERTRLHSLACDIMRRAAVALSFEYPEKSIECLLRLIELEPFDENAHGDLIVLYAKSGNRGAALGHYERCQSIFRDELGIEFDSEVRNLRDTLFCKITPIKARSQFDSALSPPAKSHLTRHRLSLEVLPLIVHRRDSSIEAIGKTLTAEIIAKLTRYHTLAVTTASTHTRSYNLSSSTRYDQVSARYRMEGSICLENQRLAARIFLCDTESGTYLWTERLEIPNHECAPIYEPGLTQMVNSLVARLQRLEHERMRGRPLESLNAYELRVHGDDVWSLHTKASHIEARRIYRESLAIDPNYAPGLLGLAWTYLDDFRYVWSSKPFQAVHKAEELARRAIFLAPDSHSAHHLLGYVYMAKGRAKAAEIAFQTALEQNPNDADILPRWGLLLYRQGQHDRAVEKVREAIHLNPNYPSWYLWTLGNVYCETGAYEDATACFSQVRNPEASKSLAASFALQGHREDAVRERDAFLASNPDFGLRRYSKVVSTTNPPFRLLQGLKDAGFPP